MGKKYLLIVGILLIMVVFTGCGKNLTDDERTIIAEYAADTLLAYDKNYNARYIEEEEPEEAVVAIATPEPTLEPTAEPTPESTPEQQAAQAEETPAPEPTEEATPEEQAVVERPQRMSALDVGAIFGLQGVEMSYTGMESGTAYPTVPDGELNFQFKATAGCKVVALKFDLFNTTQDAKTCNIVGQNLKFRLCFNGKDLVSVQKTLLLDDLAQLNVILQPGEHRNAVVICQVQDGYEQTISSIDMTVRIAGENVSFNVQ